MDTVAKSPLEELEAMRKVIEAIDGFDSMSAERILSWAAAQTGSRLSTASSLKQEVNNFRERASEDDAAIAPAFDSIADLFSAAAPNNGPECALVVAYWLQVVGGLTEFDAKSLNDELKNLGRPLPNVTATLTSLISQRPALMMQTQKIGRGPQGRKRYKLTQPGIDRVRRMLAGNHVAENIG